MPTLVGVLVHHRALGLVLQLQPLQLFDREQQHQVLDLAQLRQDLAQLRQDLAPQIREHQVLDLGLLTHHLLKFLLLNHHH